jgi:hypothetical protein
VLNFLVAEWSPPMPITCLGTGIVLARRSPTRARSDQDVTCEFRGVQRRCPRTVRGPVDPSAGLAAAKNPPSQDLLSRTIRPSHRSASQGAMPAGHPRVERFREWEHGDVEDAGALMKRTGVDVLQKWPVSKRVNS